MEKRKIAVAEHGYVLLKDWMGDDLSPVNDAKVSFDKESSQLGDREKRLITYLADHQHTSPFRHSVLKFEVYAPLMVARQWWKHVIGSEHGEGYDRLTAWNESSRRYITEEPMFLILEWTSGDLSLKIANRAAEVTSLQAWGRSTPKRCKSTSRKASGSINRPWKTKSVPSRPASSCPPTVCMCVGYGQAASKLWPTSLSSVWTMPPKKKSETLPQQLRP